MPSQDKHLLCISAKIVRANKAGKTELVAELKVERNVYKKNKRKERKELHRNHIATTSATTTMSHAQRMSITESVDVSQTDIDQRAVSSIERVIVENVDGNKETREREVRHEATSSTTRSVKTTLEKAIEQVQTIITDTKQQMRKSHLPVPIAVVRDKSTAQKYYGSLAVMGMSKGASIYRGSLVFARRREPMKSEDELKAMAMSEFVKYQKLDGLEANLVFLPLDKILQTPIGHVDSKSVYDGFSMEDFAEVIAYKVALYIEIGDTDMYPDELREELEQPWFPYFYAAGVRQDTIEIEFNCTGIAECLGEIPAFSKAFQKELREDGKATGTLLTLVVGDTHEMDGLFFRALPSKKGMRNFQASMIGMGHGNIQQLERNHEIMKDVEESKPLHVPNDDWQTYSKYIEKDSKMRLEYMQELKLVDRNYRAGLSTDARKQREVRQVHDKYQSKAADIQKLIDTLVSTTL